MSLKKAERESYVKYIKDTLNIAVEVEGKDNKSIYIRTEDGERDNIVDVGYGFSQVLPIATTLWDRAYKKKSEEYENTIVIERFYLRDDQSAKRRFIQAHEAAHVILSRHIPGQTAAAFHSEFDSCTEYTQENMKRIFSLEEAQADRLGAVLLMPDYHVGKALDRYNDGRKFIRYEGGIFSQESKFRIQNMADCLGASYSALVIRLNDLKLFEDRPIQEYIEQGLGFGGA